MSGKSRERRRFEINISRYLGKVMAERGTDLDALSRNTEIPKETLRKNIDYGYAVNVYNLTRICEVLRIDEGMLVRMAMRGARRNET